MAEKIKSWDDLKKLRSKIAADKHNAQDHIVLAVGMATCGVAAGAGEIMDVLWDEVQKAALDHVSIVSTGCAGFCYAEPMVEVRMPNAPGIKYGYVDEEAARAIVRKHVMKGELLTNAIIGQEVQRP